MNEQSELIVIIVYYGTSVTRAPLNTLYAVRDIFRRPHEETSALSGTTCIIIAESAKQIHSVCLSVRACLEKAKWLQTLIATLVMLPLYLECLHVAIC